MQGRVISSQTSVAMIVRWNQSILRLAKSFFSQLCCAPFPRLRQYSSSIVVRTPFHFPCLLQYSSSITQLIPTRECSPSQKLSVGYFPVAAGTRSRYQHPCARRGGSGHTTPGGADGHRATEGRGGWGRRKNGAAGARQADGCCKPRQASHAGRLVFQEVTFLAVFGVVATFTFVVAEHRMAQGWTFWCP